MTVYACVENLNIRSRAHIVHKIIQNIKNKILLQYLEFSYVDENMKKYEKNCEFFFLLHQQKRTSPN